MDFHRFVPLLITFVLAGGGLVATAAGAQAIPNSKVVPVRTGPAKVTKKDCLIQPDLCLPPPTAIGCGAGKHWSSAGSGLSHCVEDDRLCKNGEPATRDEFDNLVCRDDKPPAGESSTESVKEKKK